jgi:hypothetical protein
MTLVIIAIFIAIFIGHKAGLTIYAIGTAVLWSLVGQPLAYLLTAVLWSLVGQPLAYLFLPHVLPIVALSLLVAVAALMVSRWWGLLLFIVGNIAITTLFGLGLGLGLGLL